MPVLIAVLVALLWVFALRRWYRQAPSPLESVEHQQRALDALQHAASRARTGPAAPNGATARSMAVPIQGSRAQRSWTPLIAAAVGTFLLVGVGAIWWVGRNSTDKQSAISATSPTSRARRSASSTTTTTTALPPVAHATITDQSSSAVVYAVDRPVFSVGIAASGPCWVRATAPTGSVANPGSTPTSTSRGSGSFQTVFEKTMRASDTQAIPVSGALQVQLGAANNVTVSLDGQPVALPAPARSTLRLTFNGSPNGA